MKTTDSMGPQGPGYRPKSEEAKAMSRIADALERLADAYLYCNAPDEEGEESRPGQSLSDTGMQ